MQLGQLLQHHAPEKDWQELRRQLFGRYGRKHSRSPSTSRSAFRHRSYDKRGRGSRPHSRRYDDDKERERDCHHKSWSRRHRSTSPLHRRERSRSLEGRRQCSPVREGSEERRAKIEQWNKQREQAKISELNDDGDGYYNQQSEQYEH